jgi:hypothetical protein
VVKIILNYSFHNTVNVVPQSTVDLDYRNQFSHDRVLLQYADLKLPRKSTNFSMSTRQTDLVSAPPKATRVGQARDRCQRP